MITVTLLEDRVIQEPNKLEIFEKCGMVCSATDFAILLGAIPSSKHYIHNQFQLKDRLCSWWTKTFNKENNTVRVVKDYNALSCDDGYKRTIGFRPILQYTSLSDLPPIQILENGIPFIEYGEYPQYIVPIEEQNELETYFQNGIVLTTGRCYTTDSVDCNDVRDSFQPKQHLEYEYLKEKYVRILINHCPGRLSDGRFVGHGQICWVKVQPIRWLVDEKAKIAIAQNVLFSGIQYLDILSHIKRFEQSNANQYLTNYFVKEAFFNILEKENTLDSTEPEKRKQFILSK